MYANKNNIRHMEIFESLFLKKQLSALFMIIFLGCNPLTIDFPIVEHYHFELLIQINPMGDFEI